MRLQASRLEVCDGWKGIKDQSLVGIDFVSGLRETRKIGRASVLGDSECTWKLGGVIIVGTSAVGVSRLCMRCGSLYNN
jgi:hypothetical protein